MNITIFFLFSRLLISSEFVGICGNTDDKHHCMLFIFTTHIEYFIVSFIHIYLCSYYIAIENFIAYIKYMATRSRCHKIKFAISPHFLTQHILIAHRASKHKAFTIYLHIGGMIYASYMLRYIPSHIIPFC